MELKNLKKAAIPHLIVVLIFILLPILYFSPMFFSGKQLVQHDIMQYQGMAKSVTNHREQYKEDPLWVSNMFSGMPAFIVSVDHYGNKIRQVNNLFFNFVKPPATYIFTALIGFYILLLAFEVAPALAAAGAIGFAFASFMFISIEAGHNAKVACISYMPLVLGGMVLAFRKNTILGLSVFGIGLGLQIVNNHVQITYYLAFILLAVFINEAIRLFKQKQIPKLALVALGLLVTSAIAVGTNASYFLTTQEYSKYSIRGTSELTVKNEDGSLKKEGLDKDYVFNYSNSATEPLTFLIPDYFGGASAGPLGKNSQTAKALRSNNVDPANIKQILSNVPLYFGEQPYVAGPIYIGAIFCFLFVLGLFIVKDPIKYALLAVSIFGILLTYGKNFETLNYFLFDHFPLYNKFRSVTMAVVIPQVCVPLLGILALKTALETADKKSLLKYLLYAVGCTGGLALLIFVFAGASDYSTPNDQGYQFPEWLLEAIRGDRKSMRTGDALRSFVLIVFTAGLIYAAVIHKIKKELAMAGILILSLGDLWLVDKRYLNNENFEKKAMESYYTPDEADKIILQDRSLSYRVYNVQNPFNDARTSYFHQSVGGYSPAKLRRYQDLIERHISKPNLKVLNMLNTKYIITGKPENPVELLPGYLGNAWFISSIIKVKNPDEEIAALDNLDPATTAVTDASAFQIKTTSFDTVGSKATLTAFKANDLVYQVQAPQNGGFLVFSEVFYDKGWQAYLDDKPVNHIRVNYILRGMEVPAGEHKIEFKFTSETFEKGTRIALICSYLLLGGFVFGIVFGVYQGSPKRE